MMNILRMVNPIMPYAWGSKTFIQELTGDISGNNTPQAELWLGAHPKSSSQIQNGDILVNLHYILAEDPTDFLGNNIARMYNHQLPYLLKVLAADQPLSVQVHPNRKHAREGFIRENKLGIPLDSPTRNYRDEFHKPELLVALSEFHALCGFRDFEELKHLMKKYLPNLELPQIINFCENPDQLTLSNLYSYLLKADTETKQSIINSYLHHVHAAMPANPQEQLINEWSDLLCKAYPFDIGILTPLLLNIIVLKPLQGLYLEPGILHSYLKGAGIEVMANSDNVLRGGLTPKHIDIDEVLHVVDFSPRAVHTIRAEKLNDSEQIYRTTAEEFALSIIRHGHDTKSEYQPSQSPEILFCTDGSFVVENCSQILPMEKGQSLFVPYEVEGYAIQGKGTIFRAKCNL